MKIENSTVLQSAKIRNNKINNQIPSFQRNLLSYLKPMGKSKAISEDIYYVAGLINENINTVKKAFEGASEKRLEFLHTLARKYNSLGFYGNTTEKEGQNQVLDIYNKIKKPNKYHYLLVNSSRLSFEDLSQIFGIAQDKKTLEAVYKFHRTVVPERQNGTKLILDILNSGIRADFVKHFDKYSSYFKLNFRNPEAVKNLEKLIAEGQYNPAIFDRELAVNHIYQKAYLHNNPNITIENLKENYSSHSESFIRNFFDNYYYLRTSKDLSEVNTETFLKMYRTTNSENADLRSSLINNYKFALSDRMRNDDDVIQSEIEEMSKLFEKLDSDKYAKSFVEKLLKSKISLESFEELNLILDKFGTKKLNIYFSNVERILKAADKDERLLALEKGIDNPLFETSRMRRNRKQSEKYLFTEKRTYLDKLLAKVQHQINTVRYKYLPDSKYKFLDLLQEADKISEKAPQTTNLSIPVIKPPYLKPQITLAEKSKAVPNLPAPIVKPLDFGVFKNSKVENEKEMELIDIIDRKTAAKYRKLKVISDINEVLKKNMKKSMFDKNQAEYEKKATKIRLSVLPDIFNSIKETRKAAKIKGEKQNLPTKKDALTLYQLTTGRNKKLVKYMLNKTNDKGERIFSVKDIIELVKSTEAGIKEIKAVNKEFKARDARAYYNNIFDGMVEEYGKLPPRKKLKNIKTSKK